MRFDLSTVLSWVNIKSEALNINVTGLCHDSRNINSGDAFIALNGFDNHGIDFAYQVQRAGACAILAESVKGTMAKPKSRQQPLKIPVIEIENLSEKLGHLASSFYGNPSEKLKITAITGTNGKTSCAWLLLQAWSKLGINGAYIGTLGFGNLQQMHALQNTTPNALQLQKILAGFVEKGITHVSMEASSHGLSLGRTNGITFEGAGFTNISHDHLDFHETMEKYARAKQRLFSHYDLDFAIINCNDYYGKKWSKTIQSKQTTYAINNDKAMLNATEINLTPKGMRFNLQYNNQTHAIQTPLLGQFNIDNILLVVATLLNQKNQLSEILAIIPEFIPVPGRMNCVTAPANCLSNPLVIVDYAHTPDALEQVLKALQQHKARKIWCVFGCGGNRDKGKRPQMGRIAEKYSDYVIVTDDNPRFEDHQQIAADILMGMKKPSQVIHARKEAIAFAIRHSHSDDLILIAGKGHEPYQLIEGQYHPFDDRVVATQALLKCLQEKCA